MLFSIDTKKRIRKVVLLNCKIQLLHRKAAVIRFYMKGTYNQINKSERGAMKIMKKIIVFCVIIAVFLSIGYGVKRYVEGPKQSVDGILVSGTEQNVKDVKQLYQENTKQTADYHYKLVTTRKVRELSKAQQKEFGEKEEIIENKYAVITKSTAEKFIEKGIIRARKDPGDTSIISKPISKLEELESGDNLLFSFSDDEIVDGKLDLGDQLVPVQHVKNQAWIGYAPMDLIILDAEAYNKLKEDQTMISLIQFKDIHFDFKNKNKVEEVLSKISNVYPESRDHINFVDVQD
ncbi:lipoprotein BA_5634 family protein [Peribacillus aracenensis]|uniref:lipoprotein BA_5634 family protein n=1 Tax=Peribacillus aracenensis TaxID=2976708 RepID=UPI0021A47795|nr:lipoprotein BA_5634 family protein [Peribacillus sp. BBB004]